MLKLMRICGCVFSSSVMDVLMLDRAKATVSEKNKIAMTVIAQIDMKAPNDVAYNERKANENVRTGLPYHLYQTGSPQARTTKYSVYVKRTTKHSRH